MSTFIAKAENGLFGLFTKTIDGKAISICPAVYEKASNFKNNLVAVKLSGKWGFINESGQVVIAFNYDEVGDFEYDYTPIYSKTIEKWAIIHKSGFQICQYEYEEIHIQGNNLFFVRKISLFGFINTNGEVVSNFKYSGVGCMSSQDGLIPVKVDNKWGVIDLFGNEIIECKYYNIGNFSEGLIPVYVKNKWGYLNKEDDFVIQPIYDFAQHFSCQLAAVREGNRVGYINLKGEKVIESVYSFASPFSKKYSLHFLNNLKERANSAAPSNKKIFKLFRVRKIEAKFMENYPIEITNANEIYDEMALVLMPNELTGGIYGFIDMRLNKYIYTDFKFRSVYYPKRYILNYHSKGKNRLLQKYY